MSDPNEIVPDDLVADKQAADDALLSGAVEHVGTYVALKAQIGELESQAAEAKDAAIAALQADGAPAGKTWQFPGVATVQVVKGRVTERLDRAILARFGVSAEILDKATIRTEGAPSIRITAEDA